MKTGINFPLIGPNSRFYLYADLAKQRGPWRTIAPEGGLGQNDASVDTNGDPTQDCIVYIVEGDDKNPAPVPTGDHPFTILGHADVSGFASNVQIKDLVIGHDDKGVMMTGVARVGPGSLNLAFKFSNAKRQDGSPGFQGFELRLPGHSFTERFARSALAAAKDFEQVRFMEPLRGNDNETWKWHQRTLPSQWQGSSRGISWEDVFDFGNQAGVDVSVNLPYMADYEYAVEFSKLSKAKLGPGRRMYVERGNEPWNDQFGGPFEYNRKQVIAEKAQGISYTYPGDINPGNPMHEGFRRVARVTHELAQCLEAEFGTAAMRDRVRVFLNVQIGWTDYTTDVASYLLGNGMKLERIWGVGVGSYLGYPQDPASTKTPKGSYGERTDLTPQDVIKYHRLKLEDGSLREGHRRVLKEATKFGWAMGAYECGPEDLGDESIAAKIIAQNLPEMGGLILDYYILLDKELKFGNHFLVASASNRNGCWGATDQFHFNTPKFIALHTFAIGQVKEPPPPENQVPVPPPIPVPTSGIDRVIVVMKDGSQQVFKQ